jgi:hypothetical protein
VTHRIPSARALSRCNALDQFKIIDLWARELCDERSGIKAGWVFGPGNLLGANRSRLKRLRSLAQEFDIGCAVERIDRALAGDRA